MTEYNVGDRVKVAFEAEVLSIGSLKGDGGADAVRLAVNLHDFGSSWFPAAAVVEHTPKPAPLPTEPGVYVDKDGDVWRIDVDGEWDGTSPERYAPFTRLVPETAVTEAKTEAYREVVEFLRPMTGYWVHVAEHFGLTS